jgi:integrase
MRQCELLGLRRGDIDLVAGTVRVRRTIFNSVVNPPKSANGRRTIKLSKLALNALVHHLEHYASDTWVFATRDQTPINVWNLYHKSWRPLLERTGLPSSTRFHDMRHSCATLLLMKGVNARMVSNILGHKDVGFTLNVYGHVVQEMQDQAADGMDDVLS